MPFSLADLVAPSFESRFFDLDRLDVGQARLTPDEQARVARKATPMLRQRQAASFHAVRTTLAPLLGRSPGDIPIAIAAGGKPVLADGRLHFNMSHSDGIGLLAWGATEIGVDVEALIARPRDALARRILAEGEWARWAGIAEERRSAWLTRAWTRKEAALKAAGTGLRVPPSAIDVGGGDGEGEDRTLHVARRTWWCVDLRDAVPDGYRAAVCVALAGG